MVRDGVVVVKVVAEHRHGDDRVDGDIEVGRVENAGVAREPAATWRVRVGRIRLRKNRRRGVSDSPALRAVVVAAVANREATPGIVGHHEPLAADLQRIPHANDDDRRVSVSRTHRRRSMFFVCPERAHRFNHRHRLALTERVRVPQLQFRRPLRPPAGVLIAPEPVTPQTHLRQRPRRLRVREQRSQRFRKRSGEIVAGQRDRRPRREGIALVRLGPQRVVHPRQLITDVSATKFVVAQEHASKPRHRRATRGELAGELVVRQIDRVQRSHVAHPRRRDRAGYSIQRQIERPQPRQRRVGRG
mmetsp:Transcript_768/g.2716  ORF Transcript_768/g.2716 Transcript_768/m.2716 type:complete len:303 (-) Transcript_768:1470-2378(-)